MIYTKDQKLLLYIDDTGTRDLDKAPPERRDGMDWFGLGGVMIKGEDDKGVYLAHKEFCEKWNIDYPLHSSSIRGHRDKFGWLGNPVEAGYFMPELRKFLLSQPIIAIAAVIDRPGYFERYRTTYKDKLWEMDKTAFCILIERAAKYADSQNRKLEVIFEASGKCEDRALIDYLKILKTAGAPFDSTKMAGYEPLSVADYQRIVLGDAKRKSKSLPQLQLADLVLYPIVKGGYDAGYRPYQDLHKHGILIDSILPTAQKSACCIKYSCFERRKAQT